MHFVPPLYDGKGHFVIRADEQQANLEGMHGQKHPSTSLCHLPYTMSRLSM